jgi:methyl-accepting chemotaxis protein
MGEASSRAEEIFHGTDSQTRDVERMVASMDEVAKVAERNAVAIDGVVTTSQQQLGSMSEMVTSSATLTDLAEELQGVLRRFETGGSEQKGPS